MPGQRGTERRKTESQVLVRLTAELGAAVDAAAEQSDLTPPAWIRARVAETLAATPETAHPVTRQRRRAPAPEHVLAIHHLRELVAELGGAMTAAALDTRKQGLPILHDEIEALLPRVKAAVGELDALKQALDEEAR